ncbi:MAG: Bpu10I family restriction endonuclease [Planktothrix sp. GU0601_MAG3]|nr:MAG: Bpu10I family restriction endonuclease [Planktothrix sp. GU0601_MAG3]
MLKFPTPHYDKLKACLKNPQLPAADKERVEQSLKQYQQWIQALETVEQDQTNTVEKLVEVTNFYQRFIELDLIFDSSDNFLYRQKGQLKLDNTILEEFLPQLIYRSLRGIDDTFEIGPQNTFSGLSFLSSLGNQGQGGETQFKNEKSRFYFRKKTVLKNFIR